VVGIDDADTMENLVETVSRLVDNERKTVFVAGESVAELVPMCDEVEKLFPICVTCATGKKVKTKALYMKATIEDWTQVLIGGPEISLPVCRACFLTDWSK
jgi:thymidine kinase